MKLDLKSAIANSGLSQAKIAEAVGISTGYVSDLAKGNKLPSLEILLRIMETLGTQPNEIFDLGPVGHNSGERPPGMAEPSVEPFDFGSDGAIARAVTALARGRFKPEAFTATRNSTAFGICPGDILVINRSGPRRVNDLLVVTLTDETGSYTSTGLRRWMDPWLVSDTPHEPPVKFTDADQTIGIYGKVAAILRDQPNPLAA